MLMSRDEKVSVDTIDVKCRWRRYNRRHENNIVSLSPLSPFSMRHRIPFQLDLGNLPSNWKNFFGSSFDASAAFCTSPICFFDMDLPDPCMLQLPFPILQIDPNNLTLLGSWIRAASRIACACCITKYQIEICLTNIFLTYDLLWIL